MSAPTADLLNAHLKSGGIVQVATVYRATLYKEKHAGMFFQGKDGNLYVKAGKSSHCLTHSKGTYALVSIRLGHVRRNA